MSTKQSTKNASNGNGSLSDKHMPNGAHPHSQFLEHLQSYPLVSDTVSGLTTRLTSARENPYTRAPLRLLTDAFSGARARIYAPAAPYLAGPYSVLSPYLRKADELGDSGLKRFEERFPFVKDDTDKVKGLAVEVAAAPLTVVIKGRDYLLETYSKERGEVPVNGLVGVGVAVVRTEWRVAADAWGVAMRWLAVEREELGQKMEQHQQQHKKKKGQGATAPN